MGRVRNAVAVLVAGGLLACAGTRRVQGYDPAELPVEVRADYQVFAQRCSKCHSLARPLNARIDDDSYWELYVRRMRLQPSSGISVADTVPILRFLHFHSREQKRRSARPEGPTPSSAAPGPDGAT